jgi:hypothetical protein
MPTLTDEELCTQFDAAIAPVGAPDRRVTARAAARAHYFASLTPLVAVKAAKGTALSET